LARSNSRMSVDIDIDTRLPVFPPGAFDELANTDEYPLWSWTRSWRPCRRCKTRRSAWRASRRRSGRNVP